ncbi:MAG: chemotaxis protein CheB [Planctomycetota bacterium]
MSNIASQKPISADASREDIHVVGIGASAGGLEALELLFDKTPADTGMAFVVVQHLSPDFKSLMDELLSRHTDMEIFRVENGMRVEPNGIYLIPPKKNMVLSDGKLLLTEQDASGGLNLPIDIFFRSLAKDVGNKAIAIVLSGTGSDGSRGLQDIHEAGGLVVVQSIASAGFDGMPRNAIGTGMAKVITSADAIPAALQKYASDPAAFAEDDGDLNEPIKPGQELAAIFNLFRNHHGIDFTLYREATIQRRIERRMQLMRVRRLIDYIEILRNESGELEQLYRDLLVEVTQFFRDPQAFTRLREEVIPKLIERAEGPRDEIRVWVAGCATGEEAYSLAMLFNECAREANVSPIIKVFATDVHRSSLEIASSGVYTAQAIANVPEDLRKRYFTESNQLFHVNQELRQMVIFAPHNVANDPPFTRIDLVSCRNVLIYIRPDVQERVLSLFHFGMNVGGCLFLGSSETIGDLSREFETVDQHWRIFRKLRNVRLRQAAGIPMAPALSSVVKPKPTLANPFVSSEPGIDTSMFEGIIERFIPPSFVVNRHYELLHSFGDANRILKQPRGRPSLELLRLVDGDLKMALSTALHRASRENNRVVFNGVHAISDGKDVTMRVSVEPCSKKSHELLLVCLEEENDKPSIVVEQNEEQFRADDHAAQRIVDLERKLEFKKETLQTTVEELESSNEELQSTNEELVASNEELQSTNEELHSVNEELYTVNAEHQRKIEELTSMTTDMDNLIRSTDIGTIFLDRDLRIRRFTPSISSAFNILEQDIGRPIDQFAYRFENPDWISMARRVIEDGEPIELQLRMPGTKDTYLKRIRPYRELSGEVNGVVITFTDISAITRSREKEEERREHLEQVTRELQDFVYAVSHDLHAPLRQVCSAIDFMKERLPSDVVKDEEKSLSDVVRRADHMREMLDCLLQYSRVYTRGGPIEIVSAEEIISSVIERLKPEIAASNANIEFEGLPQLRFDAEQFSTCVWHILDNAIKYCRHDSPQVTIRANQDTNYLTLSFRDNGIGIQPQQLEEVFVIFRRLGVMEGVPGSGFGLALCRRILERHTGKIWVESDMAQGSTFYVRIPL